MTAPSTTAERVARVRDRIAGAAVAAGRRPEDVVLVAVSKTQPPQAVDEAVAAGVGDMGENRVQELVAKSAAATAAPRWHLVGPLQSNKAAHVVDRGWWLHGIDRDSIVDRLARVSKRPGDQTVLVQVNVGDDPAKHGCTTADAPALVERAAAAGLDVRGLMTIPPLPPTGVAAGDDARRHFAALRELRDRLARDHAGLVHLSMGMSADLEAAIAEGATLVRVGTDVFGPRASAPWEPAP